MNLGHAYPVCRPGNPLYYGGCLKIGLDRRGWMNQNTPNPRLALKWPHPCSLPIEWGSGGCPRMSTFDHEWYWTPRTGCQQGTEMGEAAFLAVALWLTRDESVGQRLWNGQRHRNRLRAHSGRRNQRVQTQSTPITTCVQWCFLIWLWRISWLQRLVSD